MASLRDQLLQGTTAAHGSDAARQNVEEIQAFRERRLPPREQ